MKKYPSKISYLLLFFIVAAILSSLFFSAFPPSWAGIVINIVVLLFIFYFYSHTYYVVDGNFLIVRAGFLINKKIDIYTIKSINATNSILSAPALSLDRLAVNYHNHSTIVISPKDKRDFIDAVLQINPQVEIQIK